MTIPVAKCSSCGACANVCARGAITMRLDKEGFFRPVIDESICSKCGACKRVCPWTRNVSNPNDCSVSPKTIAAYAKDEQVRLGSSSGGIFSVLAEHVLDCGGVVVGVAQVAPTRFEHIVVENKADLSKLRGSKYVQANPGMIYKQVRALLIDGRSVLFSGTPCQVAALYSVLGEKSFDNLWTIDIVCHGTPSVKLFEKFAENLSKVHNSTLQSTEFRDKSTGWKSYSISQMFDNGKKISEPYGQSNYMRLFLSRICQNQSCSDCKYRKIPRIADITLGDFWGVANYHPEMDDDKGTSVVLLNTIHGEELFENVSERVKQCKSALENAIAANPCIVCSDKENFRRIDFFVDLKWLSMDELFEKYCARLPLYKIILLKMRNYMLKILRCSRNM